MTARAKCGKCNRRRWRKIVAGRGYCGPCLFEREARKVEKVAVRSWRKV